MSHRLEQTISYLGPIEQLELLKHLVAQLLTQPWQRLQVLEIFAQLVGETPTIPPKSVDFLSDSDFWQTKTIDDLMEQQQISPISDLSQLSLAEWDSDAFINFTKGQRQLSRDLDYENGLA